MNKLIIFIMLLTLNYISAENINKDVYFYIIKHDFGGIPTNSEEENNTDPTDPVSGGVNIADIGRISCGERHCVTIKDGYVWGVGSSSRGQLAFGSGQTTNISTTWRNTNQQADFVVAGGTSTYAIFENELYATGNNNRGQIAWTSTTQYRSSWSKRTINATISIAGAGNNHAHIVRNGILMGVGYNANGELGDYNNIDRYTFTTAGGVLTDVEKIVGGSYFTYIIKDNKLWSTGSGTHGKLGLGNNSNRNRFTEVPNVDASDIVDLVAGRYHIIFLKSNGDVYGVGRNVEGQLGLGDYNDRSTFVKIATGATAIGTAGDTSYIIKNGTVHAAGHNGFLQFGQSTHAIYGTNNVSTWHDTGFEADAVYGGIEFAYFKRGNELYFAGRNQYGQSGTGTSDLNYFVFTKVNFEL